MVSASRLAYAVMDTCWQTSLLFALTGVSTKQFMPPFKNPIFISTSFLYYFILLLLLSFPFLFLPGENTSVPSFSFSVALFFYIFGDKCDVIQVNLCQACVHNEEFTDLHLVVTTRMISIMEIHER